MWQQHQGSLDVKPPGFSVKTWESLTRTLGQAGVRFDRGNEADVRRKFGRVMRENPRQTGNAVKKEFPYIRHNWQVADLCDWWGLPKARALEDEAKKTPPPPSTPSASPTPPPSSAPTPATPRPEHFIRRDLFDKLRAEDAKRIDALEAEVRDLKRPAARWEALDRLFGELESNVSILMEERQRRGLDLNGNQPATGGK